MNKMMNVFIFAAGAAIGSVVTWKLIKTKYEQIAQEEIDSVIEVYSRRNNDETENAEDVEDNDDSDDDHTEQKPSIADYTAKLEEMKYTNYSDKKEAKGDVPMSEPYVISPEEFDEHDDYETISLTYYADKVLANEMDEVIEPGEIDVIIGLDSLETFGEYEDDSVFVRNDEMRIDFEILLSERCFYDE